jgi:hypothetical protein
MKTNLFDKYKTNKDLESEGVWFMTSKDTGFLLRRSGGANSNRMKMITAKHQKPVLHKIKNDLLTDEESQEIGLKIFVDAVLVDWKGVTDEEGNEIPFSRENAIEVLQEVPDLVDRLLAHTIDFNNFKEELGNS